MPFSKMCRKCLIILVVLITVVTFEQLLRTMFGDLVISPEFSRMKCDQHISARREGTYVRLQISKDVHFPIDSIPDS